MKVPVLPIPALQCTTTGAKLLLIRLLSQILWCLSTYPIILSKTSSSSLIAGTPWSGQREYKRWVTSCLVSPFQTAIFVSVKPFTISVSSSWVILILSNFLTPSSAGQYLKHFSYINQFITLSPSLSLQSIIIRLTLFSRIIFQKCFWVCSIGPCVAMNISCWEGRKPLYLAHPYMNFGSINVWAIRELDVIVFIFI
jgi:hypothetical protein